MFWFNKKHPNTIYHDIRQEPKGYIPIRPSCEVQPDVIGDFRDLNFADKSFKHVIFDPPHLLAGGKNGWQRKKYGILSKATWKEDIAKGFSECWRVLEDYGTLVFKWNEESISVREVLDVLPEEPLYGHPTARSGKTKWFCFIKLPLAVNKKEDDGLPPNSKELDIRPTIL